MAEPLTKNKLGCGRDEHICICECSVGVEDLKSALDEFERWLEIPPHEINPESLLGKKIKFCLKKAFPAIYDKENGDKV